jgi:hypothetical protein
MKFVSNGQRYYREENEPLKINVDLVLVDVHPNKTDEMAEVMSALEKIFSGRFELFTSNVNPPPPRYWQHGETGRTQATVLQPSKSWDEITKEQYELSERTIDPNAYPSK